MCDGILKVDKDNWKCAENWRSVKYCLHKERYIELVSLDKLGFNLKLWAWDQKNLFVIAVPEPPYHDFKIVWVYTFIVTYGFQVFNPELRWG